MLSTQNEDETPLSELFWSSIIEELKEQEDHFEIMAGSTLLGFDPLGGCYFDPANKSLTEIVEFYFPESILNFRINALKSFSSTLCFAENSPDPKQTSHRQEILDSVVPIFEKSCRPRGTDQNRGWCDPRVPALFSFMKLLKTSDLSEYAQPLMEALYLFQAKLTAEFSSNDLLKLSPILSSLNPDLPRNNYRFFFNPAVTEDGGVIVTVFLEATEEEIRSRPPLYRNSNKHLHHSFLTKDALIKKSAGAFSRDANIAVETEHTAYTKFYLRPWTGKPQPGISMLIHPMQRARLTYEPQRDPHYAHFKETLVNFRGNIISHSQKLLYRHRYSEADPAIRALRVIADQLDIIRQNIFSNKEEEVQGAIDKINNSIVFIPARPEFEIHHSKTSNFMRRDTTVRREVLAMLRSVKQIMHMYAKKTSFHEANDISADQISGKNREFTFLAISEIFKQCLEECIPQPVYRFMLSSNQLESVRLATKMNDDSELRHRISRVPRAIENFSPIVTTKYPLRKVFEDGHVSSRLSSYQIETVCMDHKPGQL